MPAVTAATMTLPRLPHLSEQGSAWRPVAKVVTTLRSWERERLPGPARLADYGGTPLPGSPAEFGSLLATETEKWGKVVKFANIKPD